MSIETWILGEQAQPPWAVVACRRGRADLDIRKWTAPPPAGQVGPPKENHRSALSRTSPTQLSCPRTAVIDAELLRARSMVRFLVRPSPPSDIFRPVCVHRGDAAAFRVCPRAHNLKKEEKRDSKARGRETLPRARRVDRDVCCGHSSRWRGLPGQRARQSSPRRAGRDTRRVGRCSALGRRRAWRGQDEREGRPSSVCNRSKRETCCLPAAASRASTCLPGGRLTCQKEPSPARSAEADPAVGRPGMHWGREIRGTRGERRGRGERHEVQDPPTWVFLAISLATCI
jgi:hypothetical protein